MKTKKVSARTKFKEHQGQAHRGRLKQLHFLLAIRAGKSLLLSVNSLAKHAEKKKLKKHIFCEKFLRACADGAQVRHLAQQGRLKHLLVTGPSMRILQGTAIFG